MFATLATAATKTVMFLGKHKATIAAGAGIVGVGVSLFMMHKATAKSAEIEEEYKESVDHATDIHEHPEKYGEAGENYSDEDYENDLELFEKQRKTKKVINYAKPIAMAALGITLIILSHGMMIKEVNKLAASLAMTSASFATYRANVVERYGEEIDQEMAQSVKEKETTKTTLDKKGKTVEYKEVKKEGSPSTIMEAAGPFAFRFYKKSINWAKDPNTNERTVKWAAEEAMKKQKRFTRNYCTVNDFQDTVTDIITENTGYLGEAYGWPNGTPVQYDVIKLCETEWGKNYIADHRDELIRENPEYDPRFDCIVIPKGFVNLNEYYGVA